MTEIDRLTVHQGTPADNAGDPGLPTLLNRCRRHAPLTKRAVKPHGTNLARRCLLDYLERHSRMGGDHNAIEPARDTRKVRIAGNTFDLRRVGVHGQHFISTVTELPINGVRRAARSARYASYGDSLPP